MPPFRIEFSRHDILFLVGIVFLAYLNSLIGSFQFDDYNVIVSNTKVHSFTAWFHDLPRGIRPLLKLSYLLNWLAGPEPFDFHLANLIIHLINVFLVYQLTRSFAAEGGDLPVGAAFVAAGIFVLHPLQTEGVTYICGRSVSLMTSFYLGGLLAHIRWRTAGGGLPVRLLSPALFMAALLVKETALTFPFAILLWEVSQHGMKRGLRNAFKGQWLCWLLLALFVIVFLAHPRYGTLLEYSFDVRGWRENILSQASSVGYLLSRLVVLNGMNIDPHIPAVTGIDLGLAGKAVLITLLLGAGVSSMRRLPWLGFGLLWFFLHLVPTNSFIPRLDLVNDRQAYLPLAGLAVAAGWGIGVILAGWEKQRAGLAVVVLLGTLACFTALRNHDYRSEISLWEDAAAKSPQKPRVFNNLGYAYSLAGRQDEACQAYGKALRLDRSYQLAANNHAHYCQSSSPLPLGTTPPR